MTAPQPFRLSRFTTRAEAAEINRRLKRLGYRSTAELCYDYCSNIIDHFGGANNRAEVSRILAQVLD